MLAEAVSIIRDLLDGGYVNFKGAHFRVNAAKIWDLPDRSVPLGVAVSGQQSCELFAPLADVMIAVEPDGSLAGWWDAASGTGRPARKIGQMPICWGPDRDECIRRAHEQFRWFGGGWKVNAELPGTTGFTGATSFVRPEDVAGSIPCGDSVDAVAEAAEAFFKAGFTDLALVQIGGTEPGAGQVLRGRAGAHHRAEEDRRLAVSSRRQRDPWRLLTHLDSFRVALASPYLLPRAMCGPVNRTNDEHSAELSVDRSQLPDRRHVSATARQPTSALHAGRRQGECRCRPWGIRCSVIRFSPVSTLLTSGGSPD